MESILTKNNVVRDRHLQENLGLYKGYECSTDITYYSFNTKPLKSLISYGDLYSYTHNSRTEYSRELQHKYFKNRNDYNTYVSSEPIFQTNFWGGEYKNYPDYVNAVYTHITPPVRFVEGLLSTQFLDEAIRVDSPAVVHNPEPSLSMAGAVKTNVNNFSGTDTRTGLIGNQMYGHTLYHGSIFNTLRKTTKTYDNNVITPKASKRFGLSEYTFNSLSSIVSAIREDGRIVEDYNEGINIVHDLNKLGDEINSINLFKLLEEENKQFDKDNNKIIRYANVLDEEDKNGKFLWVEIDTGAYNDILKGKENGVTQHIVYEDDDNQPDYKNDKNYENYDNIFNENNKLSKNSLLSKTNDLFKEHKINEFGFGGFYDSNYENTTIDSTSVIVEYSKDNIRNFRSRGRNLIKKKEKWSKSQGYENPFCRTWTYHHQYDTLDKLIRPMSDDGEQLMTIRDVQNLNKKRRAFNVFMDNDTNGGNYLAENTVLNDNGLVNIAPSNNKDKDGPDKGVDIKKCMFSIENLAWKDVLNNREQYLSKEQRGPNGGRIMWFPPYDISFQENTNVNWESNTFIGRGEKIHTYSNTDRTGTLSFTLLIDHPSTIYNIYNEEGSVRDGISDEDILRYFAGCAPLESDDKKDKTDSQPQKKTEPTQEEEVIKTAKIYVYFPNNYSGHYTEVIKSASENTTKEPDEDFLEYMAFGLNAGVSESSKPTCSYCGNDPQVFNYVFTKYNSDGTTGKTEYFGWTQEEFVENTIHFNNKDEYNSFINTHGDIYTTLPNYPIGIYLNYLNESQTEGDQNYVLSTSLSKGYAYILTDITGDVCSECKTQHGCIDCCGEGKVIYDKDGNKITWSYFYDIENNKYDTTTELIDEDGNTVKYDGIYDENGNHIDFLYKRGNGYTTETVEDYCTVCEGKGTIDEKIKPIQDQTDEYGYFYEKDGLFLIKVIKVGYNIQPNGALSSLEEVKDKTIWMFYDTSTTTGDSIKQNVSNEDIKKGDVDIYYESDNKYVKIDKDKVQSVDGTSCSSCSSDTEIRKRVRYGYEGGADYLIGKDCYIFYKPEETPQGYLAYEYGEEPSKPIYCFEENKYIKIEFFNPTTNYDFRMYNDQTYDEGYFCSKCGTFTTQYELNIIDNQTLDEGYFCKDNGRFTTIEETPEEVTNQEKGVFKVAYEYTGDNTIPQLEEIEDKTIYSFLSDSDDTPIHYYYKSDGKYSVIDTTCNICNGTGKVSNEIPIFCKTCNGHGFTIQDKDIVEHEVELRGYEMVDSGISDTTTTVSTFCACQNAKAYTECELTTTECGDGINRYYYRTDFDLKQNGLQGQNYEDNSSSRLNSFQKIQGTQSGTSNQGESTSNSYDGEGDYPFIFLLYKFLQKKYDSIEDKDEATKVKHKAYLNAIEKKIEELPDLWNEFNNIFKNISKIEGIVLEGGATSQDLKNSNILADRRCATLKYYMKETFPEIDKYSILKPSKVIDVNNDKDINSDISKKNRYACVAIKYKTTKTDDFKDDETVITTRKGDVDLSKQTSYLSYDYVRYENEAQYFQKLKSDDPITFKRLTDKFKYFTPAFHSISPEGFNARLTFLQQCTRQGHTIEPNISTQMSLNDSKPTAGNLAFGRMPVCVLRIGDFIYSRVIINSLSISYGDNGISWDLNPEGIGVQPMYAKVNMTITILGGQSLEGPISRLQNAISFNYYANAPVYDDRADRARPKEDGNRWSTDYYYLWSPENNL